MRRLFGAVAFASTLTSITCAGMTATAAESARPGSMQFALRTEGPASSCADKCQRVGFGIGHDPARDRHRFRNLRAEERHPRRDHRV